MYLINSLPTSVVCCMITFANSLDPDQARRNVGPDLDPNCVTLMVYLKEFFEKVDFEKCQQLTKSMPNYPEGKELTRIHLQQINP